jgi:hypothetical protein
MRQLLCFKSKFPNHFVFTLGRYLFLLFLVQFNVDDNYSYIYLVNYSCSLKCIEKNLVNYGYFDNFQVING